MDKIKLKIILDELTENLEKGVIPFWEKNSVDYEFSGFLTNFDENGNELPCPEKYLNTQCRLIWWFSRIYKIYPTKQEYKQLAADGIKFLIENFWDEKYGGFYWKTNRDGSSLDNGKLVYGESFAIYALSEAAIAGVSDEALKYAEKTFDFLQIYAADNLYGGYYENLEENWELANPGFYAGDRKSLDIHMHLLESFTNLYIASKKEIHKRKLEEIIELIATKMVDRENGCGLNQFDLAFNPIPAISIFRTWNAERFGEQPADPTETTSYGHNLELVWLMNLALDTIKADKGKYLELFSAIGQNALRNGIDYEYGGLYRDGLRAGGAMILEKEFWQHAESIVGLLDCYILFKDEAYLEAFAVVWSFIKEYMISPCGEWRVLLTREGQPLDTNTGNPWKVSYHTGRGLVEALNRLKEIV